jgi:hypothetical protein
VRSRVYRAFFSGLLVGSLLTYVFQKGSRLRRKHMTVEEKVIAHAHELIAERPEAATPSQEFLRDWAYGNAGLEDERITVEQVETVLRERSA